LAIEAKDVEETLHWPKELLHALWEERKKKKLRRHREGEALYDARD
jgi:hypothetical protein